MFESWQTVYFDHKQYRQFRRASEQTYVLLTVWEVFPFLHAAEIAIVDLGSLDKSFVENLIQKDLYNPAEEFLPSVIPWNSAARKSPKFRMYRFNRNKLQQDALLFADALFVNSERKEIV